MESIMSILRWFGGPVSWPVETKKAMNSAVLGMRIFIESGLDCWHNSEVPRPSCVSESFYMGSVLEFEFRGAKDKKED